MYELAKWYTPDPPWIQCCMLIYLMRNCILLKNSRSPVRASRSLYAHAQLSAFGCTCMHILADHVILSIS